MNNTLVPDSIAGANTIAIDVTFSERVRGMFVRDLRIDIANETNLMKLTLLAEMFGVPKHLLPDDLTDFEFYNILSRLRQICAISGTTVSVRLIAEALGAKNVRVIRSDFALKYDKKALYDSSYKHEQGRSYKGFVIDVIVELLPSAQASSFEEKFRSLFDRLEPINIFLQDVRITNGFPLILPFKLK